MKRLLCLLPLCGFILTGWSQNVGIGTTTPASFVHVVDSFTNPRVLIETPSTTFDKDVSVELRQANGSTDWFRMKKYAFISPDIINGISMSGASTLFSGLGAGDLKIGALHPSAAFDMFAGGQRRMVITNMGRVGINTGNPQTQLHVVSAGGGGSTMRLEDNLTANIDFYKSSLHVASVYANENSFFMATPGSSNIPMTFYPNNQLTMVLSNGRVGIGTSTPGTLMHVYTNADIWHASIGGNTGQLLIGGQTSAGAVIQSSNPGGGTRDLYLQRDGGNVGIGTNNALAKLHVVNGSAQIDFASGLTSAQLLLKQTNSDYARLSFQNSNGKSFTIAGAHGGAGDDALNIYSEKQAANLLQVTTSPNSTVVVNGSLNGRLENFQTSASDNNLPAHNIPTANATALSIEKTTDLTVRTSISGLQGGVNGRILILININRVAPLRLLPEDFRSDPGNRFANDYIVPAGSAVTLVYRFPYWYCVTH